MDFFLEVFERRQIDAPLQQFEVRLRLGRREAHELPRETDRLDECDGRALTRRPALGRIDAGFLCDGPAHVAVREQIDPMLNHERGREFGLRPAPILAGHPRACAPYRVNEIAEQRLELFVGK